MRKGAVDMQGRTPQVEGVTDAEVLGQEHAWGLEKEREGL